MDTIYFRRLQLAASIGILPQEKQHPQTLWIDLEFDINAAQAASHDDIHDTINYAEVRASILKAAQEKHYNLLETLAEIIAHRLLQQFNINWLKLKISKPDIFDDADAVGVCIERHNRHIIQA